MKTYFKSLDYKLFIPVLVLMAFGVVMIYSSSSITAIARYDQSPEHYLKAQLVAILVGLFLFFIFSAIPYHILRKRLFIGLNVGITFLLVFLSIVASEEKNGTSSWVNIFGFSFQPAEFMKIGLIVASAFIYNYYQSNSNRFWKSSMWPLVYGFVLFACVFLFLEDLGSSLILVGIAGFMFICVDMRPRKKVKIIFTIILTAVLAGFIAVQVGVLDDYQLDRFKAMTSPFEMNYRDDSLVGYQLINGYVAMENGGLSGVGIGNSIQKYGWLPESHTDSIIALIAEELGFFGVCIVLIGLLIIVTRGLIIATKCDDLFGKYLAIGVSSYFAVQTVVNVFGITGMLPMTGVPLPLISYGGTSITATLIGVGILMSVAREQKLQTLKTRKRKTKPNLTVIK